MFLASLPVVSVTPVSAVGAAPAPISGRTHFQCLPNQRDGAFLASSRKVVGETAATLDSLRERLLLLRRSGSVSATFPHLGLDIAEVSMINYGCPSCVSCRVSAAHLSSGCGVIGRWARSYWSCEAAASVVVVTEEESETPLELGRRSAAGSGRIASIQRGGC